MSDRDAKNGEILHALESVSVPGLDQDVVSLGLVSNVTHCEGAVKAVIELPTPNSQTQQTVLEGAKAAVSKLPWVEQANLQVSFRASTAPGAEAAESEDAAPGSASSVAGVRNVIAVASGKGGVGKSTVAVNLAAALSRAGARTGILDADIYGPSIPTMLGVTEAKPSPVEGPGGKKMFGPIEAHGIQLMSMGFLVEQDRPVIWRGPMLHGALKQFFGDVAWNDLDYLVVDLPPGTGDVALSMAQNITLTGAVVVSTPQEVAMLDARKAVGMFKETGIHLLGLIENMAGEMFGSGNVEPWAKSQGYDFLGSLPLEVQVRISGDAGTPAALSEDSALAEPFAKLAEQVAMAAAKRNAAMPARKKISLKR